MKVREVNTITNKANIFINIILALYSFICIIPIIIVLSVSLSKESDVVDKGYRLIPSNITFYAYKFVFKDGTTIVNAYKNTIFVTITGTILSLIIIALFAYPLSRKTLKYRKQFTFFLFFTMLFSGGLVPWYIVCSQLLHITNTYLALILPYIMNAWYVIIMRTFFSTNIPDSIIEAARIDGAGEALTFFRIVVPLSLPAFATVGMFITLSYWNDWWLNLILTTDSRFYCLQYLLMKMLTSSDIIMKMHDPKMMLETPSETARMAMCLLAVGPIVLAYPFFQKYFVKGLTVGSLKG